MVMWKQKQTLIVIMFLVMLALESQSTVMILVETQWQTKSIDKEG